MAASVLYLSPHLDDAALSCGGLIRQQVLGGAQVTVITIFAGQPAQSQLSPFAASLHARWGSGTQTVSKRRREDQAAMELLGASTRHLDYPEAIYRSYHHQFLYLSERDLFGSPHPWDTALADEIVRAVSDLLSAHDSPLYAPLGVGNHVDHQLAAGATISLLPCTRRVIFYEDYPYVEQPGALTRRLKDLGKIKWRPQVRALSRECARAKIDAIVCYHSQLSSLFGGEEQAKDRVREYAQAITPGKGMAERYWHPLPSTIHTL